MEKLENISLTGRKKVLEKKPMNFMERIYLPSIVQGLAITFKHLFRKKATIQYPEQTREFSANLRGIHSLKRDEAGKERCRASGLCARSEAHTFELQSLMSISYAVFCLKQKHNTNQPNYTII